MAVEFDTTEFRFSHGKAPRGYGCWGFVFDKRAFRWDVSDAVFAPTSTYSEAKKWAGAEAARRNARVIVVCP